MTTRLSLLDTVPLAPGGTAAAAIATTVEVARAADRLGLHRFWLGEHHGVPELACPQTPLLIGQVADRTNRIRVGSGGVMLPNHRPLLVAEQFATLQAMHPSRIDLGLGRGLGGDPELVQALGRRADDDETFSAEVTELRVWFERALPGGAPVPPLFLLGSSTGSAELAARLGLGFAFARHLKPQATRAVTTASTGYLIVAVAIACAESAAVAEESAVRAGVIRLRAGIARQDERRLQLDELTDPRVSPDERREVLARYARSGCLIGDRQQVGAGLRRIAEDTGADELMLVTVELDGPARIRTIESCVAALETRPVGVSA